MTVVCCMCPKGTIITVKPPFDNQSVSHGLCRFHELRSLALSGRINEEEEKEYCAWVKALGGISV